MTLMHPVYWRGPKKIIEKTGFVFSQPDTLHHYLDILEHFKPEEADIILLGAAENIPQSNLPKNRATMSGRELLIRQHAYRTLVSTNYLGHAGNLFWARHSPYYIDLLGVQNVRLMYSLAVGRWNYGDWNRAYDVILTFGPHDVRQLAFCDKTRLVQVGYPRYDRYFRIATDRQSILTKLGCDPSKKTVVWLPTYQSICSIDLHAAAIRRLESVYNVIVKPHPSTFVLEPARIRLLEQLGFEHVIRGSFDNLELFRIADWVLSDYSGTAFGAIYTDRNLLLLDVPGAVDHPQVGPDSPDILIRSTLAHLDHRSGESLQKMLEDEKLWSNQQVERRKWRNHFFSVHDDLCSKRAAEAIRETHQTPVGQKRSFRKALFLLK